MGDIYERYSNYITTFIDLNMRDWTFKSYPDYCYMLEHVNSEQGNAYLGEIIHRFNEIYINNKQLLIDLCTTNDIYGNTTKHTFDNFTTCSPSNLRYIMHSLLALKYMKECSLSKVDIIEIGGGYGGLCFFIHKLAFVYDITINTYSIFDLENPRKLQQKYLNALGISTVNCVDMNDFQNIQPDSFLISNYAYSEIPMELQQKYTTQILNPYVSHGFLTWNAIDVYPFIKHKKIISEEEYPSTSFNNYYVRFKPLTDA